MMPSTVVNALFVVSSVLPPAVVALGLVFLAWPGKQQGTSTAAAKPAHAH
jgi:hypothetical protein